MKTNYIILIFTTLLFLSISTFAQDLKVFDLKLNEPFDIRECNFEITDKNTYKKRKMYRYTENQPATGKCFQRTGYGYTETPVSKDDLPPVQPPNNTIVKLLYADDLRPTIAESDDIWIGIQNSKLTGVRFYFPTTKADDVLKTLTTKYGKQTAIQNLNIQNGIGGRKDFYKATWEFPKLTVTLLSLDINSRGQYNNYFSIIGSVVIQYEDVAKPKETNPL